MDAWEFCVHQTGYDMCVPTMVYYAYVCMMVRMVDHPEIIKNSHKDCIEDQITIRAYRCSMDQFYELRYNTSMFSPDQLKVRTVLGLQVLHFDQVLSNCPEIRHL